MCYNYDVNYLYYKEIAVYTHIINLADFTAKGTIESTLTREGLHLSLNTPLRTFFYRYLDAINAYITLPQRFHLPVKISFTANTSGSGFLYFLFGDGRVNFKNNEYDDSRSRNDIVKPDINTVRPSFNNFVPPNEDVTIEVIYDYKFMQVNIGGEERYYSEKEKYMRSRLTKEKNEEGFALRFAIEQSESAVIKDITVTQYDGGEEVPCVRIHSSREELISQKGKELDEWHTWRMFTLAERPSGEDDSLKRLYIRLFDYIKDNYSSLFDDGGVIEKPVDIDRTCMQFLYDFALGSPREDFRYRLIFDSIGLDNPDFLQKLRNFAAKCAMNKSSGYYAFLRCDLRELKTKTRPELESFMYYLPSEVKKEILSLDNHLMSLKHLKLVKSIEGYNFYENTLTVAYQSKMGFIYKLGMGKSAGSKARWYVATNRSPWYRLNDYTQDMLEHIAQTSPEDVKELFSHYIRCTACSTSGCMVGTDYFYDGKKVRACHGSIGFSATARDFELIKLYVDTTDSLISSGNPGQGMTTAPFYK